MVEHDKQKIDLLESVMVIIQSKFNTLDITRPLSVKDTNDLYVSLIKDIMKLR